MTTASRAARRFQLWFPVLVVACVMAYISGVILADSHVSPYSWGEPSVVWEDEAPAEGTPAALVEKHGCWTGEAPVGVEVPGHVVYARGAEGARLGGPRVVGQALEQIFEGADHDLVVYGFCR